MTMRMMHPKAVCRSFLANLKTIEPLTERERAELMRAVQNSNVPNAVPRLLGSLSTTTIETLMEQL